MTEEIPRRTAAQEPITSASLGGAVAESAEQARQQFLIEKGIIDDASNAFETRSTDTIVDKFDDRLGVIMTQISEQVTSQFAAKNEAMRATAENLKGVLEAICGKRFQEVSEKVAALDATQSCQVFGLSLEGPRSIGLDTRCAKGARRRSRTLA